MTYELKDANVVGAPVDNKDGVSRDWQIVVISNIVGNAYSDFYSKQLSTFNFLKTDSQVEIDTKLQAAAQAYITAHYPNI
jgi:hypothetical protein